MICLDGGGDGVFRAKSDKREKYKQTNINKQNSRKSHRTRHSDSCNLFMEMLANNNVHFVAILEISLLFCVL